MDLIWFLFLSFYLASLPSFSWPMNWSAVFRKTMLRHIYPLYSFSFSLCCPFIWIWDWNRIDYWIPTGALSQCPSFLIMVSIRPSHLDFSPTEARTWRSWCVCNSHPDMESGCSWGVWCQVWELEISQRVHSPDIAWGALNCDFNRRSGITVFRRQQLHVTVVPWFGVPLCYCTVLTVSLRTSHVN